MFYPDVAQIFVNALETNLMISMAGENIGTRSSVRGSPTRIVDLVRDIVEWGTLFTQRSFWHEFRRALREDRSNWINPKVMGVRLLAFGEGILEGLSLGFLDFNFSPKLAKCWGLDEFNVSTKTAGAVTTFAVPAGLTLKAGATTLKFHKQFAKDIDEIIKAKGLQTSFKTLVKEKMLTN
jgi:hypothetical protein